MSALEKIESPALTVSNAVTPMEMLGQALERGASIEVVTKMMDLAERWEKNQARRAFDEAIAAAKAEIKPVIRNRTGHNNKAYADFAAVATAVDPIISKHGLSYRFRTKQDERISVTCVLSHKAGHYEETTLAGPADTTGNKNAIQAIGSTLTYLQRYSLVQALGLAASNDDDGNGSSSGDTLSEEQLARVVDLADEVGADKRLFCKYMKVESLAAIPAAQFSRAIDALNAKRKQ
jgi:hypothetical protein